jgi:hypothetical protein
MSLYAFDDLVEALRQSVVRAVQALDDRQLRRLARYFTVDAAGRLQPLMATVHAPPPPAGQRAETPLQVPLLELCAQPKLRLAEFSIEFDCVIDELPRDPERLRLKLESWQSEPRPGVDRVRISFMTDGQVEGAAYLNDELFKVIA